MQDKHTIHTDEMTGIMTQYDDNLSVDPDAAINPQQLYAQLTIKLSQLLFSQPAAAHPLPLLSEHVPASTETFAGLEPILISRSSGAAVRESDAECDASPLTPPDRATMRDFPVYHTHLEGDATKGYCRYYDCYKTNCDGTCARII